MVVYVHVARSLAAAAAVLFRRFISENSYFLLLLLHCCRLLDAVDTSQKVRQSPEGLPFIAGKHVGVVARCERATSYPLLYCANRRTGLDSSSRAEEKRGDIKSEHKRFLSNTTPIYLINWVSAKLEGGTGARQWTGDGGHETVVTEKQVCTDQNIGRLRHKANSSVIVVSREPE